MPHRSQAYSERCALCARDAVATCDRCSWPLCANHAPRRRDRRCPACEDEFEDQVVLLYAATGVARDETLLAWMRSERGRVVGRAALAALVALGFAGLLVWGFFSVAMPAHLVQILVAICVLPAAVLGLVCVRAAAKLDNPVSLRRRVRAAREAYLRDRRRRLLPSAKH